jgi:threonine aldolase
MFPVGQNGDVPTSIIDLRSDTVTRPTPEMYAAIQNAPLGDDVLGDDPTVSALEKLAAEKTGKESALFVPSGTMGNQIAVATHTKPGDAMLIEEEAHILYYEVGASAVLANVVSWTLPSRLGVMDPTTVAKRTLKRDLHTPGTTLLCLENTHNRGGGTIIPLDYLAEYRRIADRAEMRIHLDGARVFNAAVALGVPVSEIAKHVDSVNFCLSKGLRSPVGSVLCGTKEFIDRARIWRKRLGGGMRQAGILAACGLVSLNDNVDRLAEDHANAKTAAHALMAIAGVSVPIDTVQTNIVLVQTERPAVQWQAALREKGLWCFPVAEHRLRLVFHADVDSEMTGRAVEIFKSLA